MKTYSLGLAVAFSSALVPGVVAQHDAHQTGAAQGCAAMAPCAQVQPVVDNIISASMVRLESARQSNSGAEMRAAVDNLEGALRDIRTRLSVCTGVAAAADPGAGPTMPGMPQPPVASAPAAAMDHSKMTMSGGAPAARPGAATGAKPAARGASMDHSKMTAGGSAPAARPGAATGTKRAEPGPPMDHSKMTMGGGAPSARRGAATGSKSAAPEAPMDHSKMPMGGTPPAKPRAAAGTKLAAPAAPMDHSKMPVGGGKPGASAGAKPAPPAASMDHSKMQMGAAKPGTVMDPVNGLMVDPATAAMTTYQGQTYYFSSEQSRQEFLENPAKFAKKPKG
jgi:YHS domain-containing protein